MWLAADLTSVHEERLGCFSQPPSRHRSLRLSCDTRQSSLSPAYIHGTVVGGMKKSPTPFRRTRSPGCAHGIRSRSATRAEPRASTTKERSQAPVKFRAHRECMEIWHCIWPPFRSASSLPCRTSQQIKRYQALASSVCSGRLEDCARHNRLVARLECLCTLCVQPCNSTANCRSSIGECMVWARLQTVTAVVKPYNTVV